MTREFVKQREDLPFTLTSIFTSSMYDDKWIELNHTGL